MAGPQSPTSPRHGRRISFGGRSDKTHKSNNSANKIDLTETHEEKARRNLTTKADPTVAMYELQPSTFHPTADCSFRECLELTGWMYRSGCTRKVELGLTEVHATQGSIWKYHQFVSPITYLLFFFFSVDDIESI